MAVGCTPKLMAAPTSATAPSTGIQRTITAAAYTYTSTAILPSVTALSAVIQPGGVEGSAAGVAPVPLLRIAS